MKKHHTTFVLMVLFFTGLIVLWWANSNDIPTDAQRIERLGMVLPGLRGTSAAEIRRLEVVQRPADSKDKPGAKPRTLVFERRNDAWQMVEPVDAAADSPRLEALAQNLKNLHRSADAGTIEHSKKDFGFSPPAATVRVLDKDKKPLAALEIGRSIRDRLYVRPKGESGIDVVDARLFKGVDDPPVEWRDKSIFNLATFQIGAFKVNRPGHELEAKRIDNQWKILAPIRVVGDDMKIEGVLAELTSMRVADGNKGFVADDVRDLAPFGLGEKEATRIELDPAIAAFKPQVLFVGKEVPDQARMYYARRSDQDDVVMIDGTQIRDLGVNKNALRSSKVADFKPDRASFLRIETAGVLFSLARTSSGWELLAPSHERADEQAIPKLLARLADVQSSEFLDESKVPEPGLKTPLMTVKLWQFAGRERPSEKPASEPKGEPVLALKLGRHDVLRKTVYALANGDDQTVLALTDDLLELLPKNPFAFRNRQIVAESPGRIERLEIEREGRTFAVTPDQSGMPNHWKMTAPVDAPADNSAVTKAVTALSDVRAEQILRDKIEPGDAFGFQNPSLVVTWTTAAQPAAGKETQAPTKKTLRIGAKVAKTANVYASYSESTYVFTLPEAALLPFREELHSRQVVSFPVRQVKRLALRWPQRTSAFAHYPTPRGGPSDWRPEPGTERVGFDLSRVNALATDLSKFQTRKFVQYSGRIPESMGLAKPLLAVDVELGGKEPTRTLRIGAAAGGNEFYATTATADDGPVFLVSGTAWADLVNPARRGDELPAEIFAPPAKPNASEKK